MNRLKIALDSRTRRRYDVNGFLHVEQCHIAKEMIYPYAGYELPEMAADLEGTYYVFVSGAVLNDAASSFEGLPLLIDHHDDDAGSPALEYRVGALSNVHYSKPYLDADLHITDQRAIDLIKSGKKRELSISFIADYANIGGRFQGERYDFTMRHLRGGHVALVPEGRAGHDCLVADSRPLDFMTWLRRHHIALDGGGRKGKEELEAQRRYNRERPKADDFYYSYEWKQARRKYLNDHPMCERCHKSKSVIVDHIKPVSQGGSRLATSNLQALCAACHNRKTAAQGKR